MAFAFARQGPTPPPMTLHYVFDPLCGWCYGFSPVIRGFAEAHAGELRVEVVSGGMITGPREGAIGAVAPYIKEAYRDVERATGVRFGQAFLDGVLEEGSAHFSSVPPSVALARFRHERPDEALAFAARLQEAIYRDGLPPADTAAYGALAAEFGLDAAAFVGDLRDPAWAAAAAEDFRRAEAWGVTGFPTLLAEHRGRLVVLARGYVSREELEERFAALQAME